MQMLRGQLGLTTYVNARTRGQLLYEEDETLFLTPNMNGTSSQGWSDHKCRPYPSIERESFRIVTAYA